MQIAFTGEGLRALGIPSDLIEGFAEESSEGGEEAGGENLPGFLGEISRAENRVRGPP